MRCNHYEFSENWYEISGKNTVYNEIAIDNREKKYYTIFSYS
jgi:hypothetical protein